MRKNRQCDDMVWNVDSEFPVYRMLLLDELGHPDEDNAYYSVSENGVSQCIRDKVKSGMDLAVIPIHLDFPKVPTAWPLHRLAGYAKVEVEPQSLPLFKSDDDKPKGKPTLQYVRDNWSGLSNASKEAIRLIIADDDEVAS